MRFFKKLRDLNSSQKRHPPKTAAFKESMLPSNAAVMYQRILIEGNKEMDRPARALLLSALAAGLTISTSMFAKGLILSVYPNMPLTNLIASLGYTVGFALVICARQQLFTENTVTAVIPLMDKVCLRNFLRLLRLWGLVLMGNLIGTFIMAYSFHYLPAFPAQVNSAFLSIGKHLMKNTPGEMFSKGLFAGWLIATMVWILANLKQNQLAMIILITYLIALGEFSHIIVGSVEAFYLFLSGNTSFMSLIYPFGLPTLLGNIVGGTLIFTVLSHIQIRSDMSHFNH